jgi:signal transduction histidine kinase
MQQSKIAEMGKMSLAMSHQLKQPINVINLAIMSLESKIKKQNTDEFKDSFSHTVEDIHKQTRFINSTIGNFRDFFIYQENKSALYPEEVALKVKNFFKNVFEESNVSIIIEKPNYEDTYILGYENELMQVFLNIFENAKDVYIEKDIANREIYCKFDKDEENILIHIYS